MGRQRDESSEFSWQTFSAAAATAAAASASKSSFVHCYTFYWMYSAIAMQHTSLYRTLFGMCRTTCTSKMRYGMVNWFIKMVAYGRNLSFICIFFIHKMQLGVREWECFWCQMGMATAAPQHQFITIYWHSIYSLNNLWFVFRISYFICDGTQSAFKETRLQHEIL